MTTEWDGKSHVVVIGAFDVISGDVVAEASSLQPLASDLSPAWAVPHVVSFGNQDLGFTRAHVTYEPAGDTVDTVCYVEGQGEGIVLDAIPGMVKLHVAADGDLVISGLRSDGNGSNELFVTRYVDPQEVATGGLSGVDTMSLTWITPIPKTGALPEWQLADDGQGGLVVAWTPAGTFKTDQTPSQPYQLMALGEEAVRTRDFSDPPVDGILAARWAEPVTLDIVHLTGLTHTGSGLVITGFGAVEGTGDPLNGVVYRLDAAGHILAGPDEVFSVGAAVAMAADETATYYLVHEDLADVAFTSAAQLIEANGDLWNQQAVTVTTGIERFSLSTAGLADGHYQVWSLDAAGNFGRASKHDVVVDAKAPEVVITFDKTSLKAGVTATLTLQFSEPVLGLKDVDIETVVWTAGGYVYGLIQDPTDPTRYTATFEPEADTEYLATADLNAGMVSDLVGRLNLAAQQATVKVDTLAPEVAITSPLEFDEVMTVGDTTPVTFTLTEASTTFTADDVVVSGGTLRNFQGSDSSGKHYSATFTPDANRESPASIGVAQNQFNDAAGNGNQNGADSTLYIEVDTKAPTVKSVTMTPGYQEAPATVTVVFSEKVTDFDASDLTVQNGTLSQFKSNDQGLTWSGNFLSTLDVEDDTNTVTVGAGYTDLAGNAGTGATSANYVVDTKAPTLLSLTLDDTTLSSGETATVTATFSEKVKDITLWNGENGSIRASGGSLSDLNSADGGKTWTSIFTPSANTFKADAQVSFSDRVYDLADNSATRTLASELFTVDTLAATPNASLTTATDDGGAIVAPTNIEQGATLEYRLKKDGSNVTSTNDGWSTSYTPPATDGSADGRYTLELRQTDALGNVSESQTLSFGIGLPPVVELSAIANGEGGFVINGQYVGDQSGYSVSSAGDVNGDGLDDVIVGAPTGESLTGASYVVFGRTGSTPIDLSAVASGSGGFVVHGMYDGDRSGFSVSGAGDVNGDGLADLIVGAPYRDFVAGAAVSLIDAGESYVVFGKSDTNAIQLSAVAQGSGGFNIQVVLPGNEVGTSVSSAGDVNGDGLADLIVGAPMAPVGTVIEAGVSYVVFGKSTGTTVNLANLATGGGFQIKGQSGLDHSGYSVSSAGDLNGDGLADLIVGAPDSAPAAGGQAGRSYVVFGKATSSSIELSAVAGGSGGFVINGQSSEGYAGSTVAAAGDVNGDGLADLILGAPSVMDRSPEELVLPFGHSYVVFGQTSGTAVNLSAVQAGQGGFAIVGITYGDYSGYSVASAGDINGDGLADVIIGAKGADVAGGIDAGQSYVVYGRSGTTAVELSAVAAGSGGFAINGQGASDASGWSVSAAGDVNGDGLADLIVGAPNSDPAAGADAGRSYVIYGATTGAFAKTAVDWVGTSGDDTQTDGGAPKTLVAGAGNDSLTASRGSLLYGGAGNDQLTVNGLAILALESKLGAGGNAFQLARVDGGSGIDTLVVAGGLGGPDDLTLDLTKIANQAAGDPETRSRLSSIEAIDLGVSGNHKLILSPADVRDMAGMNTYHSGNGWTGLGTSVNKHQLRIDGTLADTVTGLGYWQAAGTAVYTPDGKTYDVYNSADGTVQLLVGQAVARNLSIVPTVELSAIANGQGGFVINGGASGDQSGYSVSSAGDVNGDGLDDLVVGVPIATSWGLSTSYVVYGRTANTEVNLSAVASGSGGFAIGNSRSVLGAGDVNGDGFADLIVGNPYADSTTSGQGASYVVFGQSASANVDTRLLAASRGFTIDNSLENDAHAGWSVSGAGDVNGDGLADLIVGAPDASVQGTASSVSGAGRSFVVFGRTATTPVQLGNLGAGGFEIRGATESAHSGYSVSSAGDFNGDGLADVVVGAPNVDSVGGMSYVVFGKTDSTAIQLSTLGSGGIKIQGQAQNDASGYSVASAGDVNGDGLADLIVGASAASTSAGKSYVVFGRTGTADVNLFSQGTGGFVINGGASGDSSGTSVSSAGDINGDGLADLIIGAPNAVPQAGDYAGRSYVVFGKSDSAAVELSAVALFQGGFVINGQSAGDNSGNSVSSAGDVNGDGLADLIVGAPSSSSATGDGAGRSYVIYGATSGAFAKTAVDWVGTSGDDVRSDGGSAKTLVAGAGNDSLVATAASVLYGGAGNDIFGIGANTLTALQSPLGSGGNLGQLARIDGGTGIDTLFVSGDVVTLDLTQIANQAAGNPEMGSRLSSIEAVDLSVSGKQTLVLSPADVRDMAGMNLYNSGKGWSGLAASVSRHQLLVDGGAGDVVRSSGYWLPAGTASKNNQTYAVYNSLDGTAQLLVKAAVTTELPFPPVELSAIAKGVGGFVINGQGASDYSGYSVSSAGDVNGDGLDDVIVAAPYSDPAAGADAGRSYVVYGKSTTTAVNLSSLTANQGFVINGQCASDKSGFSVSGAGDVNGDGLADLIVGAPYGDPTAGSDAGRSYVVFGNSTGTAINLSNLAASQGFVINGQGASDNSGWSVSGAGDVNGDGLADLIVGATGSDLTAGTDAGRSYVVFGKSDGTAVNLSAVVVGMGGFVINGAAASDWSGHSVSDAGDVNGDGLADLIVGAIGASNSAGRSFVVFGKANTTAVDLSAVAAGTGGFVINGQCALDKSACSVSGAGDINGDGLADLIIGAHWVDSAGLLGAGRSYVVFGQSTTTAIDLSAVAAGRGGFVVNGQSEWDSSGNSVSAAGDVNGDGLADLIVAANGADPAQLSGAGSSYVIFGSTTGAFSQTAVDVMGTDVANNLTDGGFAKTIVAGAGNDNLTATATSVLYGGAGDDVFSIGSTMLTALANPLGSGGNIGQLARIDGGGGFDTLQLTGGGLTFDLTKISNSAMSGLSDARLEGIECIDITGSGHNTLKLTAKDVLDMSNAFDLVDLNKTDRRMLVVTGNAGDTLDLVDSTGWTMATGVAGGAVTRTYGGDTYKIWHSDTTNATVLVQKDMTVI